MYDWYYPPYVSVTEKKEKSKKLIQKLRKKGRKLDPIEITGRKLAKNWWGNSWNENLERYADYSNRIERGRSYVRHNMVIDLKIKKGVVNALVCGSRSKPYTISITIETLSAKVWKKICKKTEGMIDSVQTLLEGKFPKEFKDLFFEFNAGLFPNSKEISFDCSCPDWASMCKHVAATLYGIGARLDNNPELFFVLRGVKMEDLVGKVVREKTKKILKAVKKKSKKRLSMQNSELSDLFGISMDDNGENEVTKNIKKKNVQSTKKNVKKKVVRKKNPNKKIVNKKITTKKATTKK